MIESKHYDADFYLGHQDGSYLSAKKVLPIVAEIFHPASVIDVGCGIGSWLKVWKEDLQVKEIRGIEGPYVSPSMLKVEKELVHFQDLKEPIKVDQKFDLAMSLEVAEHLPASHAERFVESLTALSDVVLFSAAIIGQEGTYHINEQMPEYWCKLFEKFGYVPVDYVRPLVWNDNQVEWWYQQNILFYIRKSNLQKYPQLKTAYENTNPASLLRIHPVLYNIKIERLNKTNTWIGYVRWKLYPLKKSIQKMFNKKGV
ncbi:class I SAM-dependent methyltransferase [Niastella caeni]|uniref:Class I SAM-dependent methyltransferase n=1 Tax=Niastella caeni TaxID=2569763 RepID=A0A4V4H176_9BACT|nr:class I SAM-dependent methyltransferase [Niastella caeni]THU39466.1 class I SAM-dependent methyltransferase [Niastella caeni]